MDLNWQDFVASLDDLDDDCDSNLHFSDLSGPPSAPLEFPTPQVYDCVLRSVCAWDHRNEQSRVVDNVLMRKRRAGQRKSTEDRAYLIRKKITKTTFGSLRYGVVLKRRLEVTNEDEPDSETVPWTSTDELVAVKIGSLSKIRHLRGQHWEDPVREVAALQLVGNYHPHVLGCREVLQDDKHLYTIMPYYSGGKNLHSRLFAEDTDKKRDHSLPKPDEQEAREIFRQLLLGLFHLQRKGIFHRDIALDNLVIDKQNVLKIVDLGSALRVPYTDPCNPDCVTDVSEGDVRRLMLSTQGKGKRPMYLAPELLDEKSPHDGFTCDLWSAGICLFILLVGLAPFKSAEVSEKRYHKISRGGLNGLLKSLNIDISPSACDLLQRMLWHDAKNRLTLIEVMKHPWVMAENETSQERSQEQQEVKKCASSAESVSSASSKASSQASTLNSKANSSESSHASSRASTASKDNQEARQSLSEGSRPSSKERKKFLQLPKNIKEISTPFNRKSFASTPVTSDSTNSSETPLVNDKKNSRAFTKTLEQAEIQTPTNKDKLSPHRRAAASGKQILNRLKKKAAAAPPS